MNRIETIIQKFDINPCTLSLPEAREYLYHLHEQSKPFKNKELSAEALKEFNDILERLKIIEIFYEALQKQDDSSWLDYDKLSYRLEQKPKEPEPFYHNSLAQGSFFISGGGKLLRANISCRK